MSANYLMQVISSTWDQIIVDSKFLSFFIDS